MCHGHWEISQELRVAARIASVRAIMIEVYQMHTAVRCSEIVSAIVYDCQNIIRYSWNGDFNRIQEFLISLLRHGRVPPRRRRQIDWAQVARDSGCDLGSLQQIKSKLRPHFDAVTSAIISNRDAAILLDRDYLMPRAQLRAEVESTRREANAIQGRMETLYRALLAHHFDQNATNTQADESKAEILFADKLNAILRENNVNSTQLYNSLPTELQTLDNNIIQKWSNRKATPRNTARSIAISRYIEHFFNVPTDELTNKIPGYKTKNVHLQRLPARSYDNLAFYLPDDFEALSVEQQDEILTWVSSNIFTGRSIGYRRYLSKATKIPYRISFPTIENWISIRQNNANYFSDLDDCDHDSSSKSSKCVIAPQALLEEVFALVSFKTKMFSPIDMKRSGKWNIYGAQFRLSALSRMLGALHSPVHGPTKGLGIPLECLTLALLLIPAIWEAYLTWKFKRRKFYSKIDLGELHNALHLLKAETGWLRQNPQLADRLKVIDKMVTESDIEQAQSDWNTACDTAINYLTKRIYDISGEIQVHRDPFAPILPILRSNNPLAEYKKFADEILRWIPDQALYPRHAAEAVRSYLLVRLAVILALRAKNLRQLYVSFDSEPRDRDQLRREGRGELIWSSKEGRLSIYIPTSAFKNSKSRVFKHEDFEYDIDDVDNLHAFFLKYMQIHRPILVGKGIDPGTFFVRRHRIGSKICLSYDENGFAEEWRDLTRRFAVYNPYTKRGAIPGILPHGPHSVRHIVATFVLKRSGSFDDAARAIQDNRETTERHYARFAPKDGAERVNRLKSEGWSGE